MSGVAPDPLDRIAERLSACLEVVAESEYRAPVATGWYAEDVLALVEVARAAREVTTKQQECLESLRSHGVVFTDIGDDPTNWQHVAFTIYTDLCEAESITSAALARLDEGAA